MTFPTTGKPWAITELSPAPLPHGRRVLAITARPGQESASLGGLLYSLHSSGTSISLLSLTRGEASGLNSTMQPLEAVRPSELHLAAVLLGVSSVAVSDYPDGRLSSCQLTELTERISRAIRAHSPDVLLVIDPADADADTAVAAMAACAAADATGLPVVARTPRGASGSWQISLGPETATARAAQRSAVAAHRSQSDGTPELISRLMQLGGDEWLRWLVPPAGRRVARPRPTETLPAVQRQAGRAAVQAGGLQLVPRPRLASLRPL
jgi:N-acetylglucosamine malate deacetylase 2